jgi:hypothetical protein
MKGLTAFLIVLFILAFFAILGYIIYKSSTAGFTDKEEKIKKIKADLGGKLTYKALKSKCPECTNVDYYKALELIPSN